MGVKPWTGAEHKRLRELWGADTHSGAGLAAVAAALGRTPLAVYSRAVRLGLVKRGGGGVWIDRRWTEEEDRALAERWKGGEDPAVIGERLNRSAEAVGKRLELLGLDGYWRDVLGVVPGMPTMGDWGEAERLRLRELWASPLTRRDIAVAMGRTLAGVSRIAAELGLEGKSPTARRVVRAGSKRIVRWGEADKAELARLVSEGVDIAGISKAMNRSVWSVKRAIGRWVGKGVYRLTWNKEEVRYLRANYTTQPPEKLIERLKRPWASIQRKASSLGIANGRRLRGNQLKRCQILIRQGWGDGDIAVRLDTEADLVADVRQGYSVKRSPFTAEEDRSLARFVRQYRRGPGIVDWKGVGLAVLRSPAVCRERALALGLQF